jgi:hypothetical protein
MVYLKQLFLLNFAFIVTAAAGPTPSKVYGVLPKEIPRLVVSYYPDSTHFGYQQWLREEDGKFESYFSLRTKLKASDFCATLLEANQLFPLNRMVSIGYRSQDQAKVLIKMGERLKPTQFRFFELVKSVKASDLAGKHLDASKGDVPFSMFPMLGENAALTQATLWTVAAQTSTSHVRLQIEKMPWQFDEAYLSTPFDRDTYKLAWEIGRGAQGEAGSMETLLAAAALSMLKETLAHGLRPTDGHVFMHAMAPAQARLFKMKKNPVTGKPVFSTFAKGSEEGPTDEVMIANLNDLLETFPPNQFSKKLHQISALTGGKLGWLGATEHLYTVRDYFRQDLDFVSPSAPDRSHPIVLRNGTPTAGWFMAKVSERYGVYGDGQRISQYLSSTGWHDSNLPAGWNVDPEVVADREIVKHKWIGISNLSDSSARASSGYTKLVLMAAYFYWEKTLKAEYPAETDALLDRTRFAISTGHASVVEQAERIPGVQVVRLEDVDVQADLNVKDGGVSLAPQLKIQVSPGFLFDRKAILDLIRTSPHLAREARQALRKGNWQIQHMSHDMGVM